VAHAIAGAVLVVLGASPGAAAPPPPPPPPDGPPAEAIARALANIAAAPDLFLVGLHDAFEARHVIFDPDNREHVRFRRRYRDLPVIGGDFVVHGRRNGLLDGVSQELRERLNVATQPALPEADAVAEAVLELGGRQVGNPNVQLVVYARGDAALLAYEVVFAGLRPDATPIELHVFVDALAGGVLDRWDVIQTDAAGIAQTPPRCTGDCDSTGSVAINELVRGVNISLGALPVEACRSFDCQNDGTVTIDCLVQGVNNALDGCAATPGANGHGFFYGPVTLATEFTGSTYRLSDPSRGGAHTTDMNNTIDEDGTQGAGAQFVDPDDVWGTGDLSSRQSVAVDAQYAMAETLDYFRIVHGRDGIGDDGAPPFNRVHYSSDYNNAFWSDACDCMTFGDGDGQFFYPFASLDVTGHEMTHGVVSHTAGLVYSRESGALNEAISDIFGTAVEFHAARADDPPDYLIGEKVFISGTGALRYMYRPSKDGRSRDCWSQDIGSLDVHYSSGVGNHLFYLLAEGSGISRYTDDTGATTCNGGSVAQIGRRAAERIWYRALTVYLTSTSTYASARTATLSAAADLFGADGPEHRAVAAAWSAVGVN
jgi:Zn-dependent metalloprotease